jgi:hypothetical protein
MQTLPTPGYSRSPVSSTTWIPMSPLYISFRPTHLAKLHATIGSRSPDDQPPTDRRGHKGLIRLGPAVAKA